MKKGLSITTDVYDNLLWGGRHFTPKDLDDLMAYCAAMGATRHEWIVDTIWTLYDDDGPVGYDLLAEACAAAHRHGMRFDAVYKPFEGALDHPAHTLPSTFPRPRGVPFLDTPEGIVDPIRPFLADHPEMRMARRPDDAVDPGGRITTLRLVKDDDAPCPFDPRELTIWTSARNGGFIRYTGPITVHETTQERLHMPYRLLNCRVVSLDDLALPADTRFLMVRCDTPATKGDFNNLTRELIELVNEEGDLIPSSPSRWPVNVELLHQRAVQLNRLGLTRYARTPEVTQRLRDRDAFLEEAKDMFFFGFDGARGEVSLVRDGPLAVMRGKARHIGGVLCPAYPEVRQHWLQEIDACLDRGVDGIGLRPGSHSWAAEPWAHGFNAPVLAQCERPGDVAEARRVNGKAYSEFVRNASERVRGRGKAFGVHISVPFLMHVDRDPEKTHFVRNIAWDWENWLRECADYVELRGITQCRTENVREIVDRVGLVAREAGIPMILPAPLLRHACERERFLDHPAVTCYMLYESANFTRINEKDRFEGDAEVAARIRELWKEKGWR